jgi:hypothetical protein
MPAALGIRRICSEQKNAMPKGIAGKQFSTINAALCGTALHCGQPQNGSQPKKQQSCQNHRTSFRQDSNTVDMLIYPLIVTLHLAGNPGH